MASMTSFVLKYGLMKLRTEQIGEQVAKEIGAKYTLSWVRPTSASLQTTWLPALT